MDRSRRPKCLQAYRVASKKTSRYKKLCINAKKKQVLSIKIEGQKAIASMQNKTKQM